MSLLTPRAEVQMGGELHGELSFNVRDSRTRLSFQAGQKWTVPLSSSIPGIWSYTQKGRLGIKDWD